VEREERRIGALLLPFFGVTNGKVIFVETALAVMLGSVCWKGSTWLALRSFWRRCGATLRVIGALETFLHSVAASKFLAKPPREGHIIP